MKRIALICVGLALLVPALAVAQPKSKVPVQEIDFLPHGIDGTTTGPDGAVIVLKPKPLFRNLIQLRGDFKPELLDSLHEL